MFMAHPVVEGHHEVWTSLSFWHLEELRFVLALPCECPKCYSALKVKIGHGGQDEPADQKRSGLWVMGHFPSCGVVKTFDIQSAANEFLWHALRQWQIGQVCMVARELEIQLWAAKFLQSARQGKTVTQQRRAGSALLKRSKGIK